MAPAYADREVSKILFGACANTVSSWIYWGTHGVLLTSDPSDAILGSDDYPKGFRRPNCSLAGDAGFIDPQNPCCGSRHGQGIARSIQSQSENVFLADHELCNPAIRRLESKRWISAMGRKREQSRGALLHPDVEWRRATDGETSERQRLVRGAGLIFVASEAARRLKACSGVDAAAMILQRRSRLTLNLKPTS